MTPYERAMILAFMARNQLNGNHNFLICHSGPNPVLKFLLGFPWNPMYETLIARCCIVVFTETQIIIYTMPTLTNFPALPDISLMAKGIQVIDQSTLRSFQVGTSLQDKYLRLQSIGFPRYYYLYINEADPSTQEFNFWHLEDTNFYGWKK